MKGKTKKNSVGRNTKYTEEIVKTIIDLKENSDLAIYEICEKVGITKTTYHEWINTKPEFSDSISRADKERLHRMKAIARKEAWRRIEGYEVEEVRTETEGEGEKAKTKTVKTKKRVVAGDTFLQYVLNNTDSDNFKHKEHFDHTTKGDKVVLSNIDLSQLPDEVLEQLENAASGDKS